MDDEDYELLKDYKWYATKGKSGVWHAMCTLMMHRIIMKANGPAIVDHINRDGLDNQKENLRLVSVRGNSSNCTREGKKSKYVGVTVIKSKKGIKYRAYINLGGQYKCLGHFDDEEAAAQARDEAVKNSMLTQQGREILNFPDADKQD